MVISVIMLVFRGVNQQKMSTLSCFFLGGFLTALPKGSTIQCSVMTEAAYSSHSGSDASSAAKVW